MDVRHLLSANAIIDLPFGKGQRYLSSGPDRLVGGWQVNIIQSARSGFRYSVVCSNCNGANRPSLVGDPFANLTPGVLLNRAAFSTAASTQQTFTNPAGNIIRFGTLGRNTFHGPAIFNTDVSVFKNTRITEKTKAQLGLEFFNVFNHPNFTVPQNDLGCSTLVPVCNPNGDFGQIKNNASPGRVVQYRLKYIF